MRARYAFALSLLALLLGAALPLPAAAAGDSTGGLAPGTPAPAPDAPDSPAAPPPLAAPADGGVTLDATAGALAGALARVRGVVAPGDAWHRVNIDRLDARRGWLRVGSVRADADGEFVARVRVGEPGQ